jgi:hypothetical protein
MTASQSRDRAAQPCIQQGHHQKKRKKKASRLGQEMKMRWLGWPLGSLLTRQTAFAISTGRFGLRHASSTIAFLHPHFSSPSRPPQAPGHLVPQTAGLGSAITSRVPKQMVRGRGRSELTPPSDSTLNLVDVIRSPSRGWRRSGIGQVQKKPPCPLQTDHHGLSLPGETRPKTPYTRHGIVSPQSQRRCGSVQHLIKSL